MNNRDAQNAARHEGGTAIDLTLIGIGSGDPDHLTLQAIKALNAADLILIPCKGAEKAALADLRRRICADHVRKPTTRFAEFDMPTRDAGNPDYPGAVDDWHRAIAQAWTQTIASHPGATKVALLVWGDPSLYDSTLRIAQKLTPPPRITVVPGITSAQALTAAHATPINDIGAPFTTTTGRRLREAGWPPGVDTILVMLDGDCAFTTLDPAGITIWWAAYAGMPEEIKLTGPLAETATRIVAARAEARAKHGWIMDIYLLRR